MTQSNGSAVQIQSEAGRLQIEIPPSHRVTKYWKRIVILRSMTMLLFFFIAAIPLVLVRGDACLIAALVCGCIVFGYCTYIGIRHPDRHMLFNTLGTTLRFDGKSLSVDEHGGGAFAISITTRLSAFGQAGVIFPDVGKSNYAVVV